MKGLESNDQQNSSTDHRLHADDIQFKTRGNPVGACFFLFLHWSFPLSMVEVGSVTKTR